MVTKEEVIGGTGDKFYSMEGISILQSSISCDPYSAIWYRREEEQADPWISLRDHNHQQGELMVYGQASSADHVDALQTSGGMDVYVRKL